MPIPHTQQREEILASGLEPSRSSSSRRADRQDETFVGDPLALEEQSIFQAPQRQTAPGAASGVVEQKPLDRLGALVDIAGRGVGIAGELDHGIGELGLPLDMMSVGVDMMKAGSDGQSTGEGLSAAGGKMLSSKTLGAAVTSPVDLAVRTGQDLLVAGGADKNTTDITGLYADIMPTKFAEDLGSNMGRAGYNMMTGDVAALEKQGQGILKGEAGAPLQGLAALGTVLNDTVIEDRDLDGTIMRVGSQLEGSPIAKVGDALYDTATRDVPEALALMQDGVAQPLSEVEYAEKELRQREADRGASALHQGLLQRAPGAVVAQGETERTQQEAAKALAVRTQRERIALSRGSAAQAAGWHNLATSSPDRTVQPAAQKKAEAAWTRWALANAQRDAFEGIVGNPLSNAEGVAVSASQAVTLFQEAEALFREGQALNV